MALSMLATALSFQIDKGNHAYVPVITLFTYVFIFFYSWGMGPVPFTYAAECFPLEVRMVGMSFSVFTNLLGAGLLALFVPALTDKLKHSGLLGLFAAFNVLTFILVFLLFPETADAAIAIKPGHELDSLSSMLMEELSYIFGVRTRNHIKYQFKVLDYNWNCHIRRKKGLQKPDKLYTMYAPDREEELQVLDSQGEQRPILDGNVEGLRRETAL